jgi:hypothetical protein
VALYSKQKTFAIQGLPFPAFPARKLCLTPSQLAFAYVANKMQPGLLGDHRSVELIATAYGPLSLVCELFFGMH